MNKALLQEFTVRVTQASRTELVVIMYDVILADMKEAKQALSEGNPEEFERTLKHAGRFLNELMATLDYRITLSHELLSLYSFVNKALLKAQLKRKEEPLEDAKMVIEKLRTAFAQISKEDNSGPVMQNTQQLYAGLTYGKGILNESFLDPGEKRGYMV